MPAPDDSPRPFTVTVSEGDRPLFEVCADACSATPDIIRIRQRIALALAEASAVLAILPEPAGEAEACLQ